MCEYNLTGLTGEVCPECGEAFDRAQLLAESNRTSPRIPIWSDRGVIGGPDAFIRTLLAIWFHPIRYAGRFPLAPDMYEVRHFALWCLIVVFVVWTIPLLVLSPLYILPLVIAFFIFSLGVILIEWSLAILFFVPLFEGGARRMRFSSGLAMLMMARSFVVLGAIITSVPFCCMVLETIPRSMTNTIYDLVAWLSVPTMVAWPLSLLCMGVVYQPSIQTFLRGIVGVPLVGYLVYAAASGLQAWF